MSTRPADRTLTKRGKMTDRLADLPYVIAERRQSLQELAKRFEVSQRTIKRTIDSLTSHYDIRPVREGRQTYFEFADGYSFLQPRFSPMELATLLLAQEAIAATGLTGLRSPFTRHAQSLLKKVRQSLPKSLHDKLEALSRVYGSATQPAKDFTPHVGKIEQLVNAAVACRRLRMRYHGLSKNDVSERLFDPYVVYFDPDGATLKVIGYDHKNKDLRPFSIDRISSLLETTGRFPPPDFNLREFLTEHCFNGIHADPVTVRLKAYGTTARIFAEREFHPSQKVIARAEKTAGDPETITVEMRVAGGRGLERFILSWLPEIEVLSPQSLRDRIAELLRQNLRRHDE